jgi:hypothetical protein
MLVGVFRVRVRPKIAEFNKEIDKKTSSLHILMGE